MVLKKIPWYPMSKPLKDSPRVKAFQKSKWGKLFIFGVARIIFTTVVLYHSVGALSARNASQK
jgi:hypothetical protein